MVYSKEKQVIIFTLFRGEFHEFNFKKIEEYQRSKFEKHIVYIPAKNFELEESNSSYRSDREMNIAQMQEEVLKSKKLANKQMDQVKKDIHKNFSRLQKIFDIIQHDSLGMLSRIDTLPVITKQQLKIARQKVMRTAERYAQKMKTNINMLNNHQSRINKFEVEIYKKLSIPFASIIFVLVGAPLGIMARKGNMGVAISLSLGFFILYWAFLIGGEKLADRRILSPFWAMWTPNAIVFVSGIYLIWRAVRESSFINWNRLFKIFKPKEATKIL